MSHLHFVFEGWRGEEIVESFPCVLVTERLAERLMRSGLSGFETAEAEVSLGEEVIQRAPVSTLPRFVWLRIVGVAGQDDFGIGEDLRLVVSRRALLVIQSTGPRDMGVETVT